MKQPIDMVRSRTVLLSFNDLFGFDQKVGSILFDRRSPLPLEQIILTLRRVPHDLRAVWHIWFRPAVQPALDPQVGCIEFARARECGVLR
jgi:hypothetical protein